MNFDDDGSKELWEWRKEEYSLQADADPSHCLWNELEQKEDGLLYMLGEQTPVKDCGDFGLLISDNCDDQHKYTDDRREYSQLKRRRMLQYNSSDTDVSISDDLLSCEFMKSKINGDSLLKDEPSDNLQWIMSLSDATSNQEGLDQTSERWLASCLNETEIHVNSDQMNVSTVAAYHAENTEKCSLQRQMKSLKLPVTISITPCSKLRAYPFALIKPCGAQGDTTLKDINQRIHAPFLLKQTQTEGEDPSLCYPTSAFSGKPVVVKTKIRTEGGKGSITIMRTKG
ncbi:x-ray induced transcript 1 isoform X2 [Wolffia australiana]